mgnify:CR=1 FL=1|tara:strand:+ start:1013 stop:2359 length:1347 start_codon:yes stop_codon:yes gene_type:complete
MIFAFEDFESKKNLYSEEEITKGGSIRFLESPYYNQINMTRVYYGKVYSRTSNISYLKYDGKVYDIINKDVKDLEDGDKYFIPVGVADSPQEWMCDHWGNCNFENIFTKLKKNKRYFEDLKNGNAFLMIDNSLEGYHCDEIFDYLYDNSVVNNISPKQIFFITGNLNIENNLKDWSKENPGKQTINVIPYSHFEYDIGMKVVEMTKEDNSALPTMKGHLECKEIMESNGKDAVRLYNFLNKKPRGHRMWLLNTLRKWNMIGNGWVASNKYDRNSLKIDFFETPKEELDDCNEILPMFPFENVNDKPFKHYMYNFNNEAILQSWITIISETHFDDSQKTLFLSEKTFKTIACQTPFFILGNKHSIKKLNEMGYQTFDGLLNEKYDNLDSIHRINAIVDELRMFQANQKKFRHFKWMESIFRHNLDMLKYKALYKAPPKFKKLYKLVNEL